MNSSPCIPDFGVSYMLVKIGDAHDRYRLQAPGYLDADVCLQPTGGAGTTAAEQAVSRRLAKVGPHLAKEVVQAMLKKTCLVASRKRLADRSRSLAVGRDDTLHSRVTQPDGVDRVDQRK